MVAKPSPRLMLVVMRGGQIEQIGTPQAIYGRPASSFVARFLGLRNLLPATWGVEQSTVEHPFGCWPLPLAQVPTSNELQLLIRPDAVQRLTADQRVIAQTVSTGDLVMTGHVAALAFQGASYRLDLLAPTAEGDYRLRFDLPAALVAPWLDELDLGTPLRLWLDPGGLALIPVER